MKTLIPALALLCAISPLAVAQTWKRNPANGHTYALTAPMPWTAAEAQAKAWGGHLATIRSPSEMAWIQQNSPARPIWIGFTDRRQEGVWEWVSGERVTFTSWCPGEPNNLGNEDFGHIEPSGCWNDAKDTWRFVGLVERPCRQQAAAVPFGTGCASATHTPILRSQGLPTLGGSFTLALSGFAPRPAPGRLVFGASNTSWGLIQIPLDLGLIGAGNCSLLVSMDVEFPIVIDRGGNAVTRSIRVPGQPELCGAELYVQAWALDHQSNPLGLALSDGLALKLGR